MMKQFIAASLLVCLLDFQPVFCQDDEKAAETATDSSSEVSGKPAGSAEEASEPDDSQADTKTEGSETSSEELPPVEVIDPTVLDPSLLDAVWHPETGLRSKGVRPEESESYYAILAHARDADLKELKAAANRFREIRIDQFRQKYETRYQELLDRARKYQTSDPKKFKQFNLAAEDYRRIERRRYLHFKENPEEFANYVDLFKNEEPYHGQLVTLRGHIRKLHSYSASTNDYDVTKLHETWIYTDDSQRNPAVVVCTSIPEGINQAFKESEILDHVSVTGYFFKMYAYESQDSFRVVPMLLAQRLEWSPAGGATITPSPTGAKLYATICVVAVVALFVLLRISRKDRLVRKARLQTETGADSPKFNELDLPDEVGPSFENVEEFVTDKPDSADEEK